MIRRFWLWLFGGRPMTFVKSCFRDVVSGKMVNYYIDTSGRPWLANSRWSWFRVTPHHSPDIWQ